MFRDGNVRGMPVRPLGALGLVLALLLPARSLRATAGDLDPSFGDAGIVTPTSGPNAPGYGVAMQADGKIVIGGSLWDGIGGSEFSLARYNSDGTIDGSFGIGGQVTSDFGAVAAGGSQHGTGQLALQADGKIVFAGTYDSAFGGQFALVRYNPDGSLDAGFGTGGKVTTYLGSPHGAKADALGLQGDGKLVVAGTSFVVAGQASFVLARYNSDGSLDTTFGAGRCSVSRAPCDSGNPCAPPEDCGGVVNTAISGSVDEPNAVAFQADGKIVVAGYSVNGGTYDFVVVRYHTDGSLDTGFGSGGAVQTDFDGGSGSAWAVRIQTDGKIVAAGRHGGSAGIALARYNVDGSLDATFGAGGKVLAGDTNSDAVALIIQQDGKLVTAGGGNTGHFVLARFATGGSLDPGFGSGGIVETSFQPWALAVQTDGRLVAFGPSGNGAAPLTLARYLATTIPTTTTTTTTTTTQPPTTTTSTSTTIPTTTTTTTQPPPTTTSTSTTIPMTTTTTLPCTTARCTLEAAQTSAACAGENIPAGVTTKLSRAVSLIDRADTSPANKAAKLLKKAKKALKQAAAKAMRATKGKNPMLSSDCAAALKGAADGVLAGLGV